MRAALALGSILIVLAGVSARALTEPRSAATIGRPAPDFSLQQFDGPMVSLASLRGRPALLSFYATWASTEQLTAIEALGRELGIPVYGIGLMEAEYDVALFRYNTGITMPMLLDPADCSQNGYRVMHAGPTFLVDSSGVLRARWEHPPSTSEVRPLLN